MAECCFCGRVAKDKPSKQHCPGAVSGAAGRRERLGSDFDERTLGQGVMDYIIQAGLVFGKENAPDVMIWSANAAEQIGCFVKASINQEIRMAHTIKQESA